MIIRLLIIIINDYTLFQTKVQTEPVDFSSSQPFGSPRAFEPPGGPRAFEPAGLFPRPSSPSQDSLARYRVNGKFFFKC